jgi:hypothetical protein
MGRERLSALRPPNAVRCLGSTWRVSCQFHELWANHGSTYAYLRDVLERLPTQPASRIDELLPHHWQPTIATT